MNYEDRLDLLPPERVVSAGVLSKLRRAPEHAELIAVSVADPASVSVSSAAYEAIQERVAEDTGPDSGAPEAARAAEEDAMLCGYRFGRLALGSSQGRPVLPAEIRKRADSMNLYALLGGEGSTSDGQVPVDVILNRHAPEHDSALEEAVAWAWAFGVGVAVIEADLDSAGD